MKTPVEIDSAIAAQMQIVAQIDSQIDRQVRYRDSDEAYLNYRFSQTELDTFLEERGLEDSKLQSLTSQYTGWSRYYHVTNNNGHIHTSMSCSSCFPDTEFAWRTDLSGLTPEQVVEREAYNACSVCMPIAPAEQKAARQRYNKEQRDAKAAERQAKKDAKAEKALERARKLATKVEAEIEKLGGREVFDNDYSLYGHDGRKSLYDASFDMPTTVADTLHAIKEQQEGLTAYARIRDLSDAMVQALTEKGLI